MIESDLHGQLGRAGGQGEEQLKDIEHVKEACGSLLATRSKDVNVLAKSNMFNSYSHDQSHVPCTYEHLAGLKS